MMENEILESLKKAVIDLDLRNAKKATDDALAAGIDPLKVIQEGLKKGMDVIGDKFANFEIYLPEVMLAADIMKACLAVLEPKMPSAGISSRGTVVIGTAKGDIHDIGKNLVKTLLTAEGFTVHDLGSDVDPLVFVKKAGENKADIVAISTLLTPSIPYQKDTLEYLKAKGVREKYFVIIGGGPTDPEVARKIGADGWAKLAPDAVVLCKRLIDERPTPPLTEPVCVGD